MKVVVFEAEEREAALFERIGPPHTLSVVKQPLRSDNVANYADAEIISTFIYSALSETVLRRLPSLKLIATRSTGYDHVAVDYCREKAIAVANVPVYGENTVAEHVFALLLAITHRLPEAIERARSNHFTPEGLQGIDLAGRTLGVVGAGNIGRHVIRIAKGFAMNVLAHDTRPNRDLAVEMGFEYAELDALLAASDIVSLHIPGSSGGKVLMSSREFGLMKSGAILINTARGSLVNGEALITALRSGKLAGAGLDVLPDEPLIREEAELISSIYEGRRDLRNLVADHILLHMPNVIVTPHSAFNTCEAVRRIVVTTVENIEAFLEGRPQNLVAIWP